MGLALPVTATLPPTGSVAAEELVCQRGPAQAQDPDCIAHPAMGRPREASADRASGMPGATSSSGRGRAFDAIRPFLLAHPSEAAGQRCWDGHYTIVQSGSCNESTPRCDTGRRSHGDGAVQATGMTGPGPSLAAFAGAQEGARMGLIDRRPVQL